jgi:hypothetical protein
MLAFCLSLAAAMIFVSRTDSCRCCSLAPASVPPSDRGGDVGTGSISGSPRLLSESLPSPCKHSNRHDADEHV